MTIGYINKHRLTPEEVGCGEGVSTEEFWSRYRNTPEDLPYGEYRLQLQGCAPELVYTAAQKAALGAIKRKAKRA